MSGGSKHMNILMTSRGENYLGSIIFQRAEGGFVQQCTNICVIANSQVDRSFGDWKALLSPHTAVKAQAHLY
jgi:hypothetical protein